MLPRHKFTHADTKADVRLTVFQHDRLCGLSQQLIGKRIQRLRFFFLTQQNKLVTTETRNHRLRRRKPFQPFCHHHQHRIARFMAEMIVDRLEVVDIDKHHRRQRIGFGVIDAVKLTLQRFAVKQIGERT